MNLTITGLVRAIANEHVDYETACEIANRFDELAKERLLGECDGIEFLNGTSFSVENVTNYDN